MTGEFSPRVDRESFKRANFRYLPLSLVRGLSHRVTSGSPSGPCWLSGPTIFFVLTFPAVPPTSELVEQMVTIQLKYDVSGRKHRRSFECHDYPDLSDYTAKDPSSKVSSRIHSNLGLVKCCSALKQSIFTRDRTWHTCCVSPDSKGDVFMNRHTEVLEEMQNGSEDDANRISDYSELLQGVLRKLERAADRGDSNYALTSLRNLHQVTASGSFSQTSNVLPLALYNSTLRACKRSVPPRHVEARRLLNEMREQGPAPDARSYHEVIAALSRAHEWRLAEYTFAEMKRELPNCSPSAYVYTSLISAYGKGGQWDKARNAFEALVEEGTALDTGVYNALLSAAVSAAQYREAAVVFDSMPTQGILRNVTTYNAVMTSLGRQRRLQDMESMRRDMRKSDIKPNETTFSVLITAYGNSGECERAYQLLKEACGTPWLYKSAVIFNSALGACIKSGNSDLAERVLCSMRVEEVVPTLVTYNILLMGASAERKWEQVADTFKELLSVGLVPDAITLDCLCGIEKLQVAADARNHRNLHCRRPMGAIFEETIDASLDSTHIQVNHVGSVVDISSSESDKQLGNLPELLLCIVEEELLHTAGTYSLENGDNSEQRGYHHERIVTSSGFISTSAKSDTATYAYDALLRSLHVARRGVEVESTFKTMVSRGVRRTVHTYNTLIASFEARRQWQQAGEAMKRMQEEGIAPDALTFDALIDVCEEMGQWDRATAWLVQAQEQGHLRCEDELGILNLHRIRSAGTAQAVLRWWLRRMRSRALAPLDVHAAGQGTRAILENAKNKGPTHTTARVSASAGNSAVHQKNAIPVQIRDLPEQIQVVTGWGKHSTVFGYSPVKERVIALLDGLNSPFSVPVHNIGCVVAERGEVRAWLVRDELLSLVRFLGGNKEALKRNFNPRSAGPLNEGHHSEPTAS